MLVLLFVMICEYCRAGFEGRKRRFCSDACRHKAWYRKYYGRESALVTNKCKNCDERFDALEGRFGSNGRPKLHCSDGCRRAWSIRRSMERQKAKYPTYNFECARCSKSFESRKSSGRYCSKKCRLEHQPVVQRQKYLEDRANLPETKTWVCGWCNKDLVVPYSYTGSKKYHDECKKQANRATNRKKTLKRQGYRTDYLITHEEIAERDGFVCHICSEQVDMSLPRTSRYGATLDHVIPVSKGGEDSRDNLKLAHWICNIRKSDKLEPVNA